MTETLNLFQTIAGNLESYFSASYPSSLSPLFILTHQNQEETLSDVKKHPQINHLPSTLISPSKIHSQHHHILQCISLSVSLSQFTTSAIDRRYHMTCCLLRTFEFLIVWKSIAVQKSFLFSIPPSGKSQPLKAFSTSIFISSASFSTEDHTTLFLSLTFTTVYLRK
ncbi:uncharacterized protein LOC121052760 [Rosa chinensis]|uniref:uncharacterized protein LOC121052760 n=1 Tax=Rosa chinensis TaxID=74649 RepID=UPI001AD8C780|nr:uncharacterized protein LOC121052760 [Rosa chinensis]